MTSTLLVMIVSCSCLVLIPCSAGNTFRFSDERKLREYLLPVRDATVLPVIDKTERARFAINITIPPDHILDLTLDQTGVVWLDVIMCMQWNSSSLMWDPQDFNNVTYTAFFSHLIWTPILEVHEVLIPQSAYYTMHYWKFRMAVVTVTHTGYTEFCPQVHLPLACSIEENYDAFPAEEFTCNAVVSDMSPMSHLQNIIIEERTSTRYDFRNSFSGSGFELQSFTTEQAKNSAIIRASLRRDSGRWVYLVTVPVFLMSLLCMLSLWLPSQTPARSLTFCFALVAVLLLQIQLYSNHLVHCSKPPVVLSLLGQLVIGQLMVAILLVAEISLETSSDAQQLYARLEYVYKHSVVHKYAEWGRVHFFDWAFEKFEDEMDLKESQESLQGNSASISLLTLAGIVVRSVVSLMIMFKASSFAFLFV